MPQRVDVAVIGSGFAGSILAWILARRGLCVALIDSARHPRFAIGESSTPIADSILRRLGENHGLGELRSLSTWGSWQRTHPELACGKKRGFSYFAHNRGVPFTESHLGERSLLVAASPNDDSSDTHWYRPDVDAYFWSQAIAAGAIDLTGHRVVAIGKETSSGSVVTCLGSKAMELHSEWIVDASGQAGVLAQQAGSPPLSDRLRTQSHSTFAHFRGVKGWRSVNGAEALVTDHDPFDPDDAAQHHLVQGGWVWMLRFNHGVTSVGLTTRLDQPLPPLEQMVNDYPTLGELLRDATRIAPSGEAVRSIRLQRWHDPVVGRRRILLPTAAVTLDPLHSTGIAHALAGVERLGEILSCDSISQQLELIERYRRSMMGEVELLDKLVSTAYEMLDDFDRFTTACMLYFAGAIRCEERYQRGETPERLWNSDDAEYVSFVDWACERLRCNDENHANEIRTALSPWNSAGLMNPNGRNRYAYTATKQAIE